MTAKIFRRGLLVLLLVLIVAYGYFSNRYSTVLWFTSPPPALHVNGQQFKINHLAPLHDLPNTAPWAPEYRMWPLGYEIYFPKGWDSSTGVYLRWRDSLYYTYVSG